MKNTSQQPDPAEEGARAARADVRRAQERTAEQELIAKIALEELGLETLETQGRDCLDFHDLNVASIKAALDRAFIAGATLGASGAYEVKR
jgi:hypothetical protein